jgi:hypothetical protein
MVGRQLRSTTWLSQEMGGVQCSATERAAAGSRFLSKLEIRDKQQ